MRRILLVSLSAASFALAGCRGMVSNRPPIHLNQNMDDQQRLDPQQAVNPLLFADGRAMRARVPGTEPMTTSATDPVALTGKSGDAWVEDLPPAVTLDRALLERGRDRFAIYCAPCHGAAGDGDGTVVQRAAALVGTDLSLGTVALTKVSFHDDRLRSYPLGRFVDVMTHGFNTMPAYAAQIPPQDRWAIAAYVRTLQRSRMATIDQVPSDVAAQKGWK